MKKKIKHTLNYPAMEKYMKIARKWGEKTKQPTHKLVESASRFSCRQISLGNSISLLGCAYVCECSPS